MSLRRRGRRALARGADWRSLAAGLLAARLLAAGCVVVGGHPSRAWAGQQQGEAAQSQDDPALHQRTAAQPDAQPHPVAATGHSDLPPEAQGTYPWDKLGGQIELYFEDGKLHGYMTDHMDPDPHVAPVTFDFATTHVDGHAVKFRTRVVHGIFYSFSGHLERGLAANAALSGYYLLTGTLTQHGGDADGLVRTVSLKREPGT